MTTEDTLLGHRTQNNGTTLLKMTQTKKRTIVVLVMAILGCALVFSLSDASPVPESTTLSEDFETSSEHHNSSKLVITHVVKTLEFEVDVLDDDGVDDNNTETTTELFETDIKLLDENLLRQLVGQSAISVSNNQTKKEGSIS